MTKIGKGIGKKLNINYQKELEKILEKIKTDETDKVPSLLLHSCCAPCSSYCLEYLSKYFSITVFYYNPNITVWEEYEKRMEEQKKLIQQLPVKNFIHFIEGRYHPEVFFEIAKGVETSKEGGERCLRCYYLRLKETAALAKQMGFDYFTTTLTISPLKSAAILNQIGQDLEEKFGVNYLVSDFKKKEGYQRSITLSKEYDLYRQNYCGCIYSMENGTRSVIS